MNRFAEFNNYINAPIARYRDELYNLPFNMNTFSRLWSIRTPQEAQAIIGQQRPGNLIHVIINNGAHETVGGMPVCNREMRIHEMARAAGYAQTLTAKDESSLKTAVRLARGAEGPILIEVLCANGARAKLEYALESARNGTTVIIGHARHRISDLVEGRVPCTRIGLI